MFFKKKRHGGGSTMGIPFSKLIEDIGIAVQRANDAVERSALESYLQQGYVQTNEADGMFKPLELVLNLPSNSQEAQIKVPVAALVHNTSMKLEQVDVKLKFRPSGGEELMVDTDNLNEDDESLSELTLQFKNHSAAEGIARVNNRHVQRL